MSKLFGVKEEECKSFIIDELHSPQTIDILFIIKRRKDKGERCEGGRV